MKKKLDDCTRRIEFLYDKLRANSVSTRSQLFLQPYNFFEMLLAKVASFLRYSELFLAIIHFIKWQCEENISSCLNFH